MSHLSFARRLRRFALTAGLLLAGFAVPSLAQTSNAPTPVTSPQEAFGHEVGDDYRLIDYTAFESWLKTVATQSNRIKLMEIDRGNDDGPEGYGAADMPFRASRFRPLVSGVKKRELEVAE